jgi:hypothetical protein
MKIFILSIVLLFSFPSFSQYIKQPHGTLLFATICRDGILMTADSRASFEKDSLNYKVYYAHTDSVRKIFPLGSFQVMITGNRSYNDDYIENLILSYNKQLNLDTSIQKTFENYKKYVISLLKINDSLFNTVVYIVGGYENGIPKLLLSDFTGKISFTTTILEHWLSEQDAEKYYRPIDPLCIYQLPMIRNMFKQYSADEMNVGGPINIIQITKDNKINKLQTFKFTKSYKSVREYYKAMLRNKVPVVYHYKWSKEFLMKGAKLVVSEGY